MSRPLRVLIVEDRPHDAELVLRELRRAGFDPDWQRVDSAPEFSDALDSGPDIILSDFSIPGFSGMRALEMLKEQRLEIPFILISGTIGEDIAVAAMKEGASDYLLKDRLGRLGPAVDHALEESRLRTERRTIEQELHRTLAQLQQMVDHSPAVIYSLKVESGRTIPQAVSENVTRMLGYSVEEACAAGWWASLLHPADREREIAGMGDCIGGGDLTSQYRLRHKNGSYVRVEDHRRTLLDGTGHAVGIVGVWTDISERVRSEERFRRLVDSNVQGVMFRKSDGEITGANDAFLKIVGYSREDLNAGLLNWVAMTPPEFARLDRRCQEELAAGGVCTPYEKEYICKDGSRVAVLVGVASFEYDPDEGVCFVLDLTERKKLEQQFLRSQRMEAIGTLAGGIAHDFNNVLSPIMMAVSVLKGRLPDASSQELLGILSASAKHGADMVNQVLLFAAGAEGRRQMTVKVRNLLLEIEKIVADTFLKNIRVVADIPEDLWTVTGDPTQLQQVLLNLCVNARDAMPEGGTLTLSAANLQLDEHDSGLNPEAVAGPYVVLRIEDSGSGIPPGLMDKIFDPFFTTKETSKGTGLGLSTSLGIVKNHGGFIRVYSEPGAGTEFKVYLPADRAAATEAEVESPADLPLGNGELILVVDDEDSVREVTRQTLETFGYRVLLASDGAEAVAVFAGQPGKIDAVLTDMTMPVMDGTATIQVLRRIAPGVRIIAASGLPANGDPALMERLGVDHFLPKPYTAETLLKTLREVLPAGRGE